MKLILSLKIGKSIRNNKDKTRSSQWFSILSIFLTYQLSHQMTCFEHVLFFFIRRPGDLPVLEAAQGGRVSTQYVLSNSRQSNSISLSSHHHHHPLSFPIWFNRSNSPSVTLLLSLAPVLLLFIFYPIRGLFDGTTSTRYSKLIPKIAIFRT